MAQLDSTQMSAVAGATSADEVMDFATERGVEMVDLKFVDLPGTWQHMSLPLRALDAGDFESGLGFDGSSIRGFQEIHESDMLLMPDPTTAVMDPFGVTPTLSLICDVVEPGTLQPYSRDPRSLAKRAETHLRDSGVADTSYFGPEAEFFIFDDVRYDSAPHTQFYAVDSREGNWNTARDERPNLANKIRNKEGYFPVPPVDSLQDIRNEMCLVMEAVGVPVERQHHEVATAGQAEIDMKFDTLVGMADKLMMYKYVVKNVALRQPDPSCNPYLAFAAMLLAGLAGIARRIDPSAHGMGPLDKNIYDLSESEYAEISSVPGSLADALGALDQDRAFLTTGGVFSDDLIDDYISYKLAREVDEVRLRPTPHEFYLYFDV